MDENVKQKCTFVIDKNLKKHLELVSIATGKDQSEFVELGLRHVLTQVGCDLLKPPVLPTFKLDIFET